MFISPKRSIRQKKRLAKLDSKKDADTDPPSVTDVFNLIFFKQLMYLISVYVYFIYILKVLIIAVL